MATVHQSDISAWVRCPTAFSYTRAGHPRRQNSATAFGSVMHHTFEVFERLRHTDGADIAGATLASVETFLHYWHPHNIHAICQPVDLWLPRQGYTELRARGVEAIKAYAQRAASDDSQLMATEYSFIVPIAGTHDEDTGGPHLLAGTIDRLAIRHYQAKPYVAIDDYKSGKEQQYLRQNLQFTAYAYASTRREFWTGWQGEDGFGKTQGMKLHDQTRDWARRGTWISLKSHKPLDAGWRGPADYARFALAVEQIVASMKADIYPLSLSGETCQFCDYGPICAGVGVPDKDHGRP